MNEREAMARALDLAWRGWGRVQPNPLVGAVVVRDGELVGEGWHPEFGEQHAETVALAGAGERARGATMVVTLEPCAHQGKQPPCTEAIIRSGIRKVVAAIKDPNPVAARGAERLREAGVEVELGPLADVAAKADDNEQRTAVQQRIFRREVSTHDEGNRGNSPDFGASGHHQLLLLMRPYDTAWDGVSAKLSAVFPSSDQRLKYEQDIRRPLRQPVRGEGARVAAADLV